MEQKLLVGYARTEITPDTPMPLAGYGNNLQRISQGVLDPLCATCIAFTDPDGHTLVLFTLDMIGPHDSYTPAARRAISETYGIAYDYVIIAATHTHSAPDADQKDYPPLVRYREILIQKLTQLAGQALEDRAPACLEIGTTHNENMNYVRHYILENDTVCGDNFGDPSKAPYRCHVSQADREIRLVKVCRESARDILIVNWQAHPSAASTIATEHGRAHRPFISADYVGACRDYTEEKTGMHFAYFQGAAGNINSRSRMESEQDTRDHVQYGRLLGDYIIRGLKDLHPMTGTKVEVASTVITGELNHTEDHLVEAAQLITEEWKKTNNYRHCADMAMNYGIHSPYHAGSILARSKLGKSMDIPLGAARIGNLGLGVFPYEMFDTNGKFVRDNAPYEMTLILSCANGRFNYFPSAEAFAHGCYEADMCKLAPGIAEKSASACLELLKKLGD